MTQILDGTAVAPGRGTYSERVNPCGCRGVPEGQHLPGCDRYDLRRVTLQPNCGSCGFKAATERGCCSTCGASRC